MRHTAIGVALGREYVEETVSATDVDAVPLGIDEHIAGVAAGFDARRGGTLAHREHADARGSAERDENPLPLQVERHRKVAAAVHGPRPDLLACAAIDNG